MRTFGKYRLLELIATGGMADVWRAEMTGAEGVVKEVALKLVRGEHAARSDFIRMFVQEARLASRLSHANIVQVFEFDQVDGRYFLAMELVRGRHLGRVTERARERGIRFGIARAVHVGAEVARALAYAHRFTEGGRPLGLVHRDVSPHNVLLSFEGEVKLADFGIARAMDGAGLTEPGTLKGKVAYMAPEQARGTPVDARADVFSLGVVLWELCTGRRLFARDSDNAALAAVLSDEPISPASTWNEEVPPELDAAISAALERDPARRTGSSQDLATALAGVLLRVTRSPEDVDLRVFMHRLFEAELAALHAPPAEPTRVRPVAMAGEPVARTADADAGEEPTQTAPEPRRARRRRISAAAAGVTAAAAAALAAVLAAGSASRRVNQDATSNPTATVPPQPVEPSSPTSLPTAAPSDSTSLAQAMVASTATADPAGAAAGATAAASPALPRMLGARGERGAGKAREPVAADARPLEIAPGLDALEVPSPASGEGILRVNAMPYGVVRVNGHDVGETPREIRLPAGRHRVRIERNGKPTIEAVVTVKAGARTDLLR